MNEEQSVYLSYLLRLWLAGYDDEVVWRASLDNGLAGQRRGFASLDDLFHFLRRTTEMLPEEGEER